MSEKQYAWSDSEDWEYSSLRLDSIEECFADAVGTRLSPGDDIWIGEAKDVDIEFQFDIDGFIDDLCWNNDIEDEIIPDEAMDSLTEKVEKVMEDWIDEIGIGKGLYRAVNIKKYIIPEVNG